MAAAAAAEWKIQVKGPDNKPHKLTISATATLGDLKKLVATKVNLAVSQQDVMAGFPPKPLVGADSTLLSDLKVKSGESFTIKKSTGSGAAAAPTVIQGTGGPAAFSIAKDKGKFQVHKCSSDNSCLFHAAAFIFTPDVSSDEKGVADMRALCAAVVKKNAGGEWTTARLGTPQARYVENITNNNVWGSVTELTIFSQHYNTELVVLDYTNLMEIVHSPKGAAAPVASRRRAFLLYDGQHYDVLTFALTSATKEQAAFSVKDMVAWKRARDFVEAMGGGKKPNWGALPAPPAEAKTAGGGGASAAAGGGAGDISEADLAAIAAASAEDIPPARAPAAGGGGGGAAPAKAWKCGTCTFDNKPGLKACEMCGTPK